MRICADGPCAIRKSTTFTEDDWLESGPPANAHHHWSSNIGGDDGGASSKATTCGLAKRIRCIQGSVRWVVWRWVRFNPGIRYEEANFIRRPFAILASATLPWMRLNVLKSRSAINTCAKDARDWMEWDAPESVCIHPSANASTLTQ